MNFASLLSIIIATIWLMLPAYLSNPAASVGIHFTGKGFPIDFGKCYGKQRILGDGKTYQGFLFGIIFGIIVGLIQLCLAQTLNMPQFNPIIILTLPIGALLGDMIASFVKRRINIDRGASFPLIDQLDFVFGAWALTYLFEPNWFISNFSIPIIITTLIITPILHLTFNIIGYKIGVSKNPW